MLRFYIYNLLFGLGLILSLPFLLVRMITTKRFRQGLKERLTIYPPPNQPPQPTLWVQAASVGEVTAAAPLIAKLNQRFQGLKVIVTCQTFTGKENAQKLLSRQVEAILSPLDIFFTINRFLKTYSPEILILIETEIWPGLIMLCARRKIPVVVCNGRISDRSYPGYRRARILIQPLLKQLSALGMRTQADADRIKKLGAPTKKIQVTGNIKYDSLPPLDLSQTDSLSQRLGKDKTDLILVGGSTARGEELILFKNWKLLNLEFPNLRLLLAPRHLERLETIIKEIKEAGGNPQKLSTLSGQDKPEVVVIDTFGILYAAYGLADLVFVGKSLTARGGQNPIEPAAWGKPVIFGPGMDNFRHDADLLIKANAAIELASPEALAPVVANLLKDKSKREKMGDAGRETVQARQGATKKNLDLISEILKEHRGIIE